MLQRVHGKSAQMLHTGNKESGTVDVHQLLLQWEQPGCGGDSITSAAAQQGGYRCSWGLSCVFQWWVEICCLFCIEGLSSIVWCNLFIFRDSCVWWNGVYILKCGYLICGMVLRFLVNISLTLSDWSLLYNNTKSNCNLQKPLPDAYDPHHVALPSSSLPLSFTLPDHCKSFLTWPNPYPTSQPTSSFPPTNPQATITITTSSSTTCFHDHCPTFLVGIQQHWRGLAAIPQFPHGGTFTPCFWRYP